MPPEIEQKKGRDPRSQLFPCLIKGISLDKGEMRRVFVLPNGKPEGRYRGTGLPKGLKKVMLEVIKNSGGELWMIFKATTRENKRAEAHCLWDGKELENKCKFYEEQISLRELYKRVLSGKKGVETKEGKDITAFVQSGSGSILQTFILPNGKQMFKVKSRRGVSIAKCHNESRVICSLA